MSLILASHSKARRQMLMQAGVAFEIIAPCVDEPAARARWRRQGLKAWTLADALAALKAVDLSANHPGRLVLGSDQTFLLDGGIMFDKPCSRNEARAQLLAMAGRTHTLFSAAVIACNGAVIWRTMDDAQLTARAFSARFIDAYLDAEYEQIRHCVGGYRIEGPGIQLFSRIEGSHFTILGLPLLAVLDYLRTHGVLIS